MSPKMAREADESDEEEADRQDVESRMQRVRTERRELHSAVGSERCAGQSPTASQSPQSLRYITRCKLGWQRSVYMRWETYGWQMGKITESQAARLVSSRNSTTASCGPTAARDRPSCKLTTMAMGHTLAIILGSSWLQPPGRMSRR